MASEQDRIGVLTRLYGPPPAGVRVGIGDDAAVLAAGALGEGELVWTVDEQVEGVHFDPAWLSWEDVGYRATMAAASDLAAMGAEPVGALSSLVLPPSLGMEAFEALGRGIAEATRELGSAIVGGNLAKGPSVVVSTTWLGRTARALLRSGAQPGDVVCVAGAPGLAAAGLRALQAGFASAGSMLAGAPELAAAVAAWRRPRAQLAAGRRAAVTAHAGADVSDGLAGDLGHIAVASAVRIVLDADAVVAAGGPMLARACARLGLDPLTTALRGGEDYALVVTASEPPEGFVPLGEVHAGDGVVLRRGGREERLTLGGFDHFTAPG